MKLDARIRITRVARADELAEAIAPSVDNLAGNVAKRMRRLVPKRTFRLQDTIEKMPTTHAGGVVRGGVRFGGKVVRGRLVNYHLWVENGTSRMAAQPYARPALYQSRSSDLVTRVEE